MKITVIGAGSWGTALALHFSQHGNRVSLWTRNADQVRQMQEARENKRGLPGFSFPETLEVCADLADALKDSGLVLIVTSVAGLRSSAELLKQYGAGHLPVLAACKGFEQDTGLLTFQVLKEVLPDNKKSAYFPVRVLHRNSPNNCPAPSSSPPKTKSGLKNSYRSSTRPS